MKISISTTIFGAGFPFEKGLEMLHAAGYALIEISRKNSNIGSENSFINSLGIKVWSVHGALSADAVSLSEELRAKSVAQEYRRMEDAAVFAPCPYVVHYLNRYNDPAYGKSYHRSIEDLHKKALEFDFNLAVETVPYKPGRDERYASSREIADFVRSFDSPNLSLCLDLNHSNLNEKLEEVCRNCRGLISNIHVSDNQGKWEDHLPPGEGIIDFPSAFGFLRQAGYKGPCNLECHLESPPSVEKLIAIREFITLILHKHQRDRSIFQ